jgi:Arc/MetJ-type ribon-helix-helix transcriptional regulator
MSGMRGITIKLPEAQLRRLREQAKGSNRSVSAVVRDLIDGSAESGATIYALSSDLAGSQLGGTRSATNGRRKFGRK